MQRVAFGVCLACLVWSSACVTKKSYIELETRYGDATAALAAEQGKTRSLEQALQEEQARSQAQAAEIAELTVALEQARLRSAELMQQLALAQEDHAQLEQQLAETLKDRSKLKESIDEMRRALALATIQRRATEARIAAYKRLLARFQAMIDAGKLEVRIINGRMVIILRSDVLFASGSIKISDEGTAAVVELTNILADMPNRAFQVEGHTDNKPIKTTRFPSNWELAAGRAIAVANVMIDAGLPASAISAASFGENAPTASNDTEDGRAQNRRIEIVLVPDLSELPGFEELETLGRANGT